MPSTPVDTCASAKSFKCIGDDALVFVMVAGEADCVPTNIFTQRMYVYMYAVFLQVHVHSVLLIFVSIVEAMGLVLGYTHCLSVLRKEA
jgi:hypothetical protein